MVYPDGGFTKDQLEEILNLALEMRRRVKEQLKKLGGMEFYDVNFSYIDKDTFEEHYVSVPEQGGGKLIPEGLCNHRNRLATEDLIYCELKSQKKELIIYIRDVVSNSDCQPVDDRQT